MDQSEKEVNKTSQRQANSSPDLVAHSPLGNALPSSLPATGALIPGQIVCERYKIISVIGEGAMGCVYKVEQILLKKQFALKTLNSVFPSDSSMLRFHKEAQATSRLEHPNLARAFDFGLLESGHPFFVMEFVEGTTLSDHLKMVGRLPLETALRVFIPICFAMDYAHQAGIIHRDIKPGNIVLMSSQDAKVPFIAKIVDFGIAKIESEGQTLTKTGEIFGTPLYMSPEQCDGVGIGNQSDIYSLGCVLYEALTGAPPFQGQSALSTMLQHRSATALSLREASLGLEFPDTLEKIVAKMLAKDPTARYQSCLRVAEDLIALEQGSPELVRASTIQKEQPQSTASSRRNARLSMATAVIAVAAAGMISVVHFGNRHTVPEIPVTITPPISEQPYSAQRKIDEQENRNPDPRSFRTNPTKFEFNIPRVYNMGWFYWWEHSKIQKKAAEGKFVIPPTAILRLSPNVHTYYTGYMLGFNDGDFPGLCIDRHEVSEFFTDKETLNRTLFALRELPSLSILWIKGDQRHGAISIEGLKSIAHLNLRWLMIEDCMTSGNNLAEFVDLHKLRVLAANHMDTSTAILKALTPRGQDRSLLQALSLNGSHVTPADIKTLCRFHELTTLDLRENYDFKVEPTIKELAVHLPHLQRLSISGVRVNPRCIETFKAMKNLKLLVLPSGNEPDIMEKLQKALAPNCTVKWARGEIEKTGDWFNPLTEDPAHYGIWDKSEQESK
jgi:serine/threonine protein kinase